VSNPYAREPLGVLLGGTHVRVPWVPADRWIECTTSSAGLLGILTGLTDDETGDRIIDRVLSGEIGPEAVAAAAYDLMGQAAPYRWWKTARLLALSTRDDIAGHLTLEGLDPHSLTVAQWCAAVYVLVTRTGDRQEKFKTDVVFDDPPPGVTDNAMDDDEFKALIEQARNAPGQK
jgi:hypothetical protein